MPQYFAGAPTFPTRRNTFAALSASGWDAFDFFLRCPQPRAIALCVSPCNVKSGALSDGGRVETSEGPTSHHRRAISNPGEEKPARRTLGGALAAVAADRNCRSEKHRHPACPETRGERPAGVEGTLSRLGRETRAQPRGEEKANRNTCQFRNRCNTLTTKDITFSNKIMYLTKVRH